MTIHRHRPTLSYVVHHGALRSLESLEAEWRHPAKTALELLCVLHTRWRLNRLVMQRRVHLVRWIRSLLLWPLLHERLDSVLLGLLRSVAARRR